MPGHDSSDEMDLAVHLPSGGLARLGDLTLEAFPDVLTVPQTPEAAQILRAMWEGISMAAGAGPAD
jgi:hypothetical protein